MASLMNYLFNKLDIKIKTVAPCNHQLLQASFLSINQGIFKYFPTAQLGWGMEHVYIRETKNHHTGSTWPGRKMGTKNITPAHLGWVEKHSYR